MKKLQFISLFSLFCLSISIKAQDQFNYSGYIRYVNNGFYKYLPKKDTPVDEIILIEYPVVIASFQGEEVCRSVGNKDGEFELNCDFPAEAKHGDQINFHFEYGDDFTYDSNTVNSIFDDLFQEFLDSPLADFGGDAIIQSYKENYIDGPRDFNLENLSLTYEDCSQTTYLYCNRKNANFYNAKITK